jgi:hypothetical protein
MEHATRPPWTGTSRRRTAKGIVWPARTRIGSALSTAMRFRLRSMRAHWIGGDPRDEPRLVTRPTAQSPRRVRSSRTWLSLIEGGSYWEAGCGPVHHHGPRTPRTDRQPHGDGGEHGARRVLEHDRRITRRDPSLGVGVGAPARSPEIGSAANVGRIAFSHTSNRAMVSPTSTYLRVRERDRRSTSGAAIDGDDPTASW